MGGPNKYFYSKLGVKYWDWPWARRISAKLNPISIVFNYDLLLDEVE